jgi:hypothetical protein
MAARYWVGGTGNWSDATNHWSDVSGGTPNASFLPTSVDDVYIDNLSGSNFTLTISANCSCKNFNSTGCINVVLYNNTNTTALSIYGSLVLSASLNFQYGSQSRIDFKATTSETITFNGCNFIPGGIYFNGIGGKWIIQDNGRLGHDAGGSVLLYNGELDINGYTVNSSSFYVYTGVKTLTLGSGTLKTRTLYINDPVNFTFNYNTGTIYIGLYRQGQIFGSLTCYNLTLETGIGSVADAVVDIRNNITVLNNLVINGTNGTTDRLLVRSDLNNITSVSSITITAQNVSVANADFMGITGAGAGDWDLSSITGGAGNGGSNTNIIFTPAKTCYWYGNSGSWSDLTKWFSATNGGGSANYFPLLHDSVIFDANSLSASSTVNLDFARIGNITFATIDQSLIITTPSVNMIPGFYSSLYASVLLSYSILGTLTQFFGRGNNDLDTKGVNFKRVYIYSPASTYKLLSDVVTTSVDIYTGHFDTDGYDLLLDRFYHFTGNLYLRDSLLKVTQNNGTPFTIVSNLVAGTSTIEIAPNGGSSDYNISLNNSSKTFYILLIGGTSTGFCTIPTGGRSHNFSKIIINAGRKVKFYSFPDSAIKFNIKELDANGSVSNPIVITSQDTLPHRLHCTGYSDIIVTYCNISYSTVTGTAKIKTILGKTWASMSKTMGVAKASIKKIMGIYVNSAWIATNSTDSGNNTGWNFN